MIQVGFLRKEVSGMIHKNIFFSSLVLCLVVSLFLTSPALAAGEKKITVTILSCSAMNAAPEIRSILSEIDGILKHRIDSQLSELTVTFDPEKTNAAEIVEALENEGFDIHGSPKVFD